MLLALLAWGCSATDLDRTIAHAVFDPAIGGFPARQWPWLELVGHRLAKSLVWIVWCLLAAAALGAGRVTVLAPHRRTLWAATVAMATGPALVTALKRVTGPNCPWDLVEFGGHAQAASAFLTGPGGAGQCFPSGHAAGGFSLFALHFAGLALGDDRLARFGLWAGAAGGTLFGLVRIVQGAHFASHNLWAGVVVWCAAALVFQAFGFPAAEPDAGREGLADVPRETEGADDDPLPADRQRGDEQYRDVGAHVAVGQAVEQPAVASRLVAHVADQRTDHEVDQVAPHRVADEVGEVEPRPERTADQQAGHEEAPAKRQGQQRQRTAALVIAQRRVRIVRGLRLFAGVELEPAGNSLGHVWTPVSRYCCSGVRRLTGLSRPEAAPGPLLPPRRDRAGDPAASR